MSNEYRAKVFKSGNSVALRLPKVMGLADGDEVVIAAHAGGSFSLWREDRALDVLMGLYGSMSAGFMIEGRGETEQDERDWRPGTDPAAAA